MNKLLYWTPRVLMIIFIAFISLFALDSFDGEQSFIKKLGGFLIHLIPTFVLIVLLVFAWRHEWIGAITFLLLAIAYIIMAWDKFTVVTYLVISGPLFVTSILFWINWIKKVKQLKE